jgi:hypothetical protein
VRRLNKQSISLTPTRDRWIDFVANPDVFDFGHSLSQLFPLNIEPVAEVSRDFPNLLPEFHP